VLTHHFADRRRLTGSDCADYDGVFGVTPAARTTASRPGCDDHHLNLPDELLPGLVERPAALPNGEDLIPRRQFRLELDASVSPSASISAVSVARMVATYFTIPSCLSNLAYFLSTAEAHTQAR